MVESKLVELVVAGSSPVGHPTFSFKPKIGGEFPVSRIFIVATKSILLGTNRAQLLQILKRQRVGRTFSNRFFQFGVSF
jgi:hypothetical protein